MPRSTINLGDCTRSSNSYQRSLTTIRHSSFSPPSPLPGLTWGVALQSRKQKHDEIAAYQHVLTQHPQHLKALNNLGTLLEQENRLDGAITCYHRACQLAPDDARPLFNLGRLLAAQKNYEAALPYLKKAVALTPNATEKQLVYEVARLALGDWQDYDQRMQQLSDPSGAALSSLLFLHHLPLSPYLQTLAAQRFAQKIAASVAELKAHCALTEPPATGKLCLGHLSPDFREHAVGFLIHQLFQHHDHNQFEVCAYSLFPKADEFTDRIREGCDVFVNLAELSTEAAARRIHADDIHILIDLAGYTAHSRPDILALQPASLQIQYLGYPGTMGAEFIPIILADSWLVLLESACHYTEQVVHLPHAFVASELPVADQCPTRSEVGLPEQGMVYCAFHLSDKINSSVFAIWMRILQQVPDGVLWLSAGTKTWQSNLKQAAQRHGIAPNRLIFAPKRFLPDYLAQYQLADLFLDTWTYSTGSTAVCALANGVPLLTCSGRTYASHMGASVLAAVGLEALICNTPATYEQQAIQFGLLPTQLRVLRQHLLDRQALPLFQLNVFVRSLESTLIQIWQSRPP